ncbi:MAG: light-regulated signal transduction histidine kinase (bacteriophytochrome) [Candidatus Azotimanducaceae bacterium]|jgi:light-regulated signal transduction histidine kinase (bacteriophytochrome)
MNAVSIAEQTEDQLDQDVSSASYASAILNILDDFAEEKARLQSTEQAMLNILEDFELEKAKVETANSALKQAVLAAAAANKELATFSYSVAHDLRAPLRSIDGFSEALLEDCGDELSDLGKGYLTFVRDSAQRMAQLIDDLLSLSKMSQADMRPQPVDLIALIIPIITDLRRGEPSRIVDVVMPEELVVVGDPPLLKLALLNLLANAWKFTSKQAAAKIEIGIGIENGVTTYFVRDDGAGFDMAYADKLFGVFQRLHTPADFDGTGIGLATVKRVVDRHGGRIWADGEVDHGATFHFTLGEHQ